MVGFKKMYILRMITVVGILLIAACGGGLQEEAEDMAANNTQRHKSLIAKSIGKSADSECARLVAIYQAEYDEAMESPFRIPDDVDDPNFPGKAVEALNSDDPEAVPRFWLDVHYEVSKIIDAHEPDINHYCR